jgi:hypothetical protein
MGIGYDTIGRLIELRLAGLLRRRTAVIEIGAQQLANNFLGNTENLKRLGAVLGIDKPFDFGAPAQGRIAHGGVEHLDSAAPPARLFWQWLGFEYAAIDVDGGAGSIPLDLNFDSVLPQQRGRYHLVTNFGTTEHVANQLNAFEVIHDLTARDGLMMHQVPAQGFSTHGLINYNFKFFWMLARSNGYRWIHADYSQSPPYDLPSDIVDFIGASWPGASVQTESYKVSDAGIRVVMQKVFDIPFVPPLDVATGTQTSFDALRQRYWTVFDPDAFTRLQAARLNGGGSGP